MGPDVLLEGLNEIGLSRCDTASETFAAALERFSAGERPRERLGALFEYGQALACATPARLPEAFRCLTEAKLLARCLGQEEEEKKIDEVFLRHSRRSSERAELLSAVRKVRNASLREVLEKAAAELLPVGGAAAGLVFLDGANTEPILAVSGLLERTAAAALIPDLRFVIESREPSRHAPYSVPEGHALAVPFKARNLAGALFTERLAESGPFKEPDVSALLAFAEQVGAAAETAWSSQRIQLDRRERAAILDSLSEGVVAVCGGAIRTINAAAARLLGLSSKEALGRPVVEISPQLARLLDFGERLDEVLVRVGERSLLVNVRPIRDEWGALEIVASLTEKARAERQARRLADPDAHFTFDSIVGRSAAIGRVKELGRIAAQSNSSLLIEGESGVGKEVLAQAAHNGGPRCGNPFVAINCAALPRELVEGELFGYEPGAFTGAISRGRLGKFESAQGGSLLLDDVGEMPLDIQTKLLRVLQERRVVRLGGSRSHQVDVRIIATSNRPLAEAVQLGRFRSDVYYRLNVLRIVIPPLRERREDLPVLADHFLKKSASVHGLKLQSLGPDALCGLESYSWPGNIRELENCIDREVHFAPPRATCLERLTHSPGAEGLPASAQVRPVRETERAIYAAAIAAAVGNISRAAKTLGISRGKLYRKLREYGLRTP
jgi:sigma-54 dependent transcriptional regulator, acetoin dehydrogenase operon transcriptional activator AcoR